MTQNAVNGNGASVVAFSTPNISAKVIASTQVMVANPQSFLPIQVVFTLPVLSTLTTPCTVSLSTTPGGNDIMGATLLNGLNVLNKSLAFLLSSSKVIDPNTSIYCNVTIPAVASNYAFRCTLLGVNL